MGDHRATVTIKFEFHGKTYEIKESWWNWSPKLSEAVGVDERVIDFFREATEDGMRVYYAEVYRYNKQPNAKDLEDNERAELARLKAKYDK